MDKKILVVVLVIAVLVVGGFLVLGRNSSNNTMQTAMQTNTNGSVSETNKVTINNFAFGPQSVKVKTGTTVTWTNNDSSPHTVTADSGAFDLSLGVGKSASFTFTKAGTYSYHCSIHPSMTGTVVVE